MDCKQALISLLLAALLVVVVLVVWVNFGFTIGGAAYSTVNGTVGEGFESSKELQNFLKTYPRPQTSAELGARINIAVGMKCSGDIWSQKMMICKNSITRAVLGNYNNGIAVHRLGQAAHNLYDEWGQKIRTLRYWTKEVVENGVFRTYEYNPSKRQWVSMRQIGPVLTPVLETRPVEPTPTTRPISTRPVGSRRRS